MKTKIILSIFLLLHCLILRGQSPDGAAPPARPIPAQPPAPSDKTILGNDMPFFNPGNEVIVWDGKNWNINNSRLFQARFEKYLSAPEETTEGNLRYQKMLQAIIDVLAPGNKVRKRSLAEMLLDPRRPLHDSPATSLKIPRELQDNSLVETIQLLPQVSKYAEDANHCNILADAMTSALLSKGDLSEATLKKGLTEVRAKAEFQGLLVELFTMRRFQHVLIGTRAYRFLFADGETKLNEEYQDVLKKGAGVPLTITIGILDSMANAAMRDVREGVDAYKFLLQKNELESATKRLGEAFIVGEFMPEIRTLPREEKRPALVFSQKSYKLVSAIEVKDYTLAESLVKELEVIAKDFDNSKPMAVIETARTLSKMHLAKARNAAVSGNREILETELKEATKLWPRNPDLAQVSSLIFSQADVQQQALLELDKLLSQQNYRQVFDDKIRFIAAAALSPEHKEQLGKVLDDMQIVEGSIMRANEMSKHGDHAGAWENLERTYRQFPNDNKLNQERAKLANKAADFVKTVETARELEEKGQAGSSLAWYLKAQKIYPSSELAQEGVYRIVKKIIPEP